MQPFWSKKRKERGFLTVVPRSQRSRTTSPVADPTGHPSPTPSDPVQPSDTLQPPPPTQPPIASSSGSANRFLGFGQPSSTSHRGRISRDQAQELASCFQALLNLAEKALDGLPIWGPKAAVGTTAEALRITRLKVENDGIIKDIKNDADHLLRMFMPANANAVPVAISSELQAHADVFKAEIQEHLRGLDQYVAGSSSSRSLGMKDRMKTWRKTGKEILAADAISKALPDINRKIAASIQNFLLFGQIRVEASVETIRNDINMVQDSQEKVRNDMAMVQRSQETIRNDISIVRESQVSIQQAQTVMREAQITKEERDLLDRLRPVDSASHNAKGAAKGCHEGTRLQVLEGVSSWFHNPASLPIYWISGIAGTGKTTIAHSICDILNQSLGAEFFFSRDDFDRSEPSRVLPTIIYQLAYFRPVFRKAICDVLSSNPDIARQKVQIQAQKLLFQALGSVSHPTIPTTLLLFDALDECKNESNDELGIFIAHLLNFIRIYPTLFRLVLTSRPEAYIRQMLKGRQNYLHPFVLHEVDADMVRGDIEIYLRFELAKIAKRRHLENTWPAQVREEHVKRLAELADRLFVFASTAVKVLSKLNSPHHKVEALLSKAPRSTKSFYEALDSLYLQIILAVVPEDEDDAADTCAAFRCLVGAIVTVQHPLNLSSLGKLLEMDEPQLYIVIDSLYSVLDISDTAERPIRVFHPSFPEFLIDDTRCTDPQLCIQPQAVHYVLAFRCLVVMNEQLCQDICNIQDSSFLNTEIEDLAERRELYTSNELRYASLYWWAHLACVDFSNKELMRELTRFTSAHLLHWMELLSLMGHLQSALTGLPKATAWCKGLMPLSHPTNNGQIYKKRAIDSNSTNRIQAEGSNKGSTKPQNECSTEDLTSIESLFYDANRTIQAFFRPISESALQVYESALTFMPHCSLLSQSDDLCSKRVKMNSERRAQWSQDVRIMEGHRSPIDQVAVAPNGSLVASRSEDGTIRLWDFASGAQIMQINSPSRFLVFALDGLQLLSLTKENVALETWDVVSGDRVNTFHLHLDANEQYAPEKLLCGMAISSAGNHVVVGLIHSDIHVHTMDGTVTRLHGHKTAVEVISFSQDGLRIASGSSNDRSICVWDLETMRRIAMIRVRFCYSIHQVSISPDGLRVIAVVRPDTSLVARVYIWQISTQKLVSSFRVTVSSMAKPSDHMTSRYPQVFFLVNVKQTSLVWGSFEDSGALYKTSITSGHKTSVFKGHMDDVTSIGSSPDGTHIVSGSKDRTIRIWDTQVNVAVASSQSLNPVNKKIQDMIFGPVDSAKLITTYHDRTTCCWEICSGRLISKTERQAIIVGILPRGTVVGLHWEGSTISVWNAETGEDITTLRGHSHDVRDAAFSPDFTRLAPGSFREVRIWNTATWECTATLTGHTSWVRSVCFSPDGSRVVSGSDDSTARMWDAGTGDALAVLEGHTQIVGSVRFSSDGLSIVSKDYGGNEREWKAGVDFPLPSSPSPPPPVELDDSGWLFVTVPPSHTRCRLCWLPVERRGVVRSSGRIVALGSAAGVVNVLSAALNTVY